MATKAHLTVTGKHVPLTQFIEDHSHAADFGHFFNVAVPIPRKFANDEGYKIEEWGTPKQPQVTLIGEKRPLEHPKDFSLDEVRYEFHWAEHLVSPPNRWLERASELYELAMLLEFSNGDVITILETNSKGEITLDKELDKAAALEFFDLQERLHGYKLPTVAPTLKDALERHRPSGSEKIAQLLLDVLTEEELRLTLHKYADVMRSRQREENNARIQKERENDPYWILKDRKNRSIATLEARLKEARDKGELQAAAGIAATHQDLMYESVTGWGETGAYGGLTKDFNNLAKDLYNFYPDLREYFPRVMLLGGLEREVRFRDAYKRVVKNAKDRERKLAKRLQEESSKVKAIETPKINLFGNVDNGEGFNLNNLLSAEAASLKGGK